MVETQTYPQPHVVQACTHTHTPCFPACPAVQRASLMDVHLYLGLSLKKKKKNVLPLAFAAVKIILYRMVAEDCTVVMATKEALL